MRVLLNPQKSKSIPSPEQNYFTHFAIRYHVFEFYFLQVVKLTTSVSYESTRLVDEINSLKNEQNSISPVDEFAKHSKLERKILKLRQELESFNQETSVSRVQAKAAFATIWKTIGGI